MSTPSTATIRSLAGQVHEQSQRHGLIGPEIGYTLEEGSQTNGRAWRLYTLQPGETGLYNGFTLDWGYIGWTKAEAELTLLGMLAVLHLVHTARQATEVPS